MNKKHLAAAFAVFAATTMSFSAFAASIDANARAYERAAAEQYTYAAPQAATQPNEFAHQVAQLANKLSNGSIIVQRYGDIQKGRRTTEKRLKEGYTVPTLPEAVPGDLGLVLPYNTMKSIVEMIEALDHVTPGIANEHTLLYGVEAKFYSARPKVREGFETLVDGLYVAGDGAGLTRGLAQAGANGILVARDIIKRLGE